MKKKRRGVTLLPVSRDGLIGAEAYEVASADGLIKAGVRFGMTRSPGSATEVIAAFADIAKRLRELADALEGMAVKR